MKKLSIFLALISLGFIWSCKNNNDPKEVLSQFFDALHKKDIAKAKSLATESSQQMLDLMASDLTNDKNKESNKYAKDNLFLKDAVIDGEKASVDVVDKSENNGTITFLLKKEKGNWKVAFDKETIIGMGMKAAFGKEGMNGVVDSALHNIGKELMNSEDSTQE